jgi:hypothetical protein
VGYNGIIASPLPFAVAARGAAVALADPGFVARSAAGAAVVGIGVAARGALQLRELDAAMTAAALSLVLGAGSTTIALEESPAVGARMNAFVHRADVDVDEVLRDAFGPWRNPVFREFLVTLRGLAADGGPAVEVVGVDTRADDPDQGFVEGVERLLGAPGGPVTYLGGVAHSAATALRIAGEDADRDPFGARLARRGVPYLSLALTVGHVAGDEVIAIPTGTERDLTAAGLDAHWLSATGVPPAVSRWFRQGRTMLAVGPRFDPDDPGGAHLSVASLGAAFATIGFVSLAHR